MFIIKSWRIQRDWYIMLVSESWYIAPTLQLGMCLWSSKTTKRLFQLKIRIHNWNSIHFLIAFTSFICVCVSVRLCLGGWSCVTQAPRCLTPRRGCQILWSLSIGVCEPPDVGAGFWDPNSCSRGDWAARARNSRSISPVPLPSQESLLGCNS